MFADKALFLVATGPLSSLSIVATVDPTDAANADIIVVEVAGDCIVASTAVVLSSQW
jgi:hypothetical protein